MALTKLPKNAFGTGSVDDTKIEDGTIQNQEISGTLPETKLATGTIENASLSNSSITINGTSISLGGSSSVGVDVNWQSVITADGSTATTGVAGNGYFIDTTSAAHTFNLPASATLGDQIAIKDYAGTFSSNNLTIGRNGHNIQGVANDSLISTNRASLLLVYVDSTKGWIYAEESNVADLQAATFIAATGGTITESGDYKIHTFTGDGCFVVSTIGNSPTVPTGGPNVVDYLVVAGGGSAGGGAGGFRMSNSTGMPAPTTSPLANPTGITVTATTYPITIGAGGTTGATRGSNSIFSTITSAGGGSGGNCVGPGGSGAGQQVYGPNPFPAGTGNTPPTSPSQGNNGGNISDPANTIPPSGSSIGKGAGGGAAAAGANVTLNPNGDSSPTGAISGGVGSYVSPTMAGCNGTTGPVPGVRYFSGGGAGFTQIGAGIRSHGSGGAGGGAPSDVAVVNPTCGTGNANATANTGGGGASAYYNNNGQGGKGIVIIRYKFQ